MVQVKSTNKTWRIRLFGNTERREAAVTIAHEASDIESYPEISRCVFAECSRRRRGNTVGGLVTMKCFSRAFPSSKGVFTGGNCANPNIAARVFKETEHFIRG